jgi:glycosyltransferase involved in cell wall biosynthesis
LRNLQLIKNILMHIVQALVSLNIGGSELVATELAEYLVPRGHQVTMVAAAGPLSPRVEASGASHLDWPIGKKSITTLAYIRRLRGWFAEQRPDIVHLHSRWPAWICWRAIAGLPAAQRPAFITTMHGHYSVSPYSAVMARGARVIAVSEHIRNYTMAHYPDADPASIVTIHGGASRAEFPYGYQPRPGWRESVNGAFPELEGKRWLLLPGRVTRWKGHSDFLRLLAALAADHPDVHGIFVGGCREGSSYQRELQAQARSSGVGDKLTFTGNRLDIRDWMAASDLVFNLSSDPPEAFGRTVLESLCLGRPLLGWQHGGAAEIMAAMFPQGAVEPGNMTALEAKARDFLADPPQVAASNAFSLEGSMQAHLDLYQSVLRAGSD